MMDMTESVRWGILATGGIATKFVEDLQYLPDAEVLAVGSRNIGSAEKFADQFGIARPYGSWRELAADPDVDAIYVATPHSAHRDATMVCLAAGKATLTEKPFTLDLATSQELVDVARTARVFLMEAMWTRFFPVIREIETLIGDGAIGTVIGVHADFGFHSPYDPTSRWHDPKLGGGALLDLGVYPITIAHLFLGPPDEITAKAKLTPDGVDENTAMILSYASGAQALLSCSLVGDTPRRAAITGTTGRIEIPRDFFHPAEFTLFRDGAEPQTVRSDFPGMGYQFEAAEVQRCVRAGLTESPVMPLDESLSVMATLDAVRAKIGVSYPI